MLRQVVGFSVVSSFLAFSLTVGAPPAGYGADVASTALPSAASAPAPSASLDVSASPYFSMTTTNRLKEAREAEEHGDFDRATSCYRSVGDAHKDCIDFWVWLYDAAIKAKKWDQAGYALDKIFEIDPSERQHLQAEYGQALYHLGKWDEAIAALKSALVNVDHDPLASLDHLRERADRHQREEMAKVEVARADVEAQRRIELDAKAVKDAKAKAEWDAKLAEMNKRTKSAEEIWLEESNNLSDCCNKSEGIVIAEYLNYIKDPKTQFFHPPQANYHIDDILKGPPLSRSLPLRYEFHDQLCKEVPENWAFGADKMPAKGTKWILFLSPAVPKLGLFETYHGSYGRFPADSKHLNQVYKYVQEHSSI